MNESIARRVARLISGSFHSLIDSVENIAPEVVMEQAIREIDSVIAETRGELGRQIAQKHLAGKRLDKESTRHHEISRQIEIAVAGGRDDLAEAGISEQMDIEARIPVLESSIAECLAREKELEGFIHALQSKKRDMRSEMAAFQKIQQELPVSVSSDKKSLDGKAEKAVDAFGRILERVSGLPGKGMDSFSSVKIAELEDLARKNRIAERLAVLKAGRL